MIPKPVGRKVLVIQDETPAMHTIQEKPTGLVVNADDVKNALSEAAKEGKLNYEYEGLEAVAGMTSEKPAPVAKPSTGVIVEIGKKVDTSEMNIGDRIKFAGQPAIEMHGGTEYLLIHEDSVLLNLGHA